MKFGLASEIHYRRASCIQRRNNQAVTSIWKSGMQESTHLRNIRLRFSDQPSIITAGSDPRYIPNRYILKNVRVRELFLAHYFCNAFVTPRQVCIIRRETDRAHSERRPGGRLARIARARERERDPAICQPLILSLKCRV